MTDQLAGAEPYAKRPGSPRGKRVQSALQVLYTPNWSLLHISFYFTLPRRRRSRSSWDCAPNSDSRGADSDTCRRARWPRGDGALDTGACTYMYREEERTSCPCRKLSQTHTAERCWCCCVVRHMDPMDEYAHGAGPSSIEAARHLISASVLAHLPHSSIPSTAQRPLPSGGRHVNLHYLR